MKNWFYIQILILTEIDNIYKQFFYAFNEEKKIKAWILKQFIIILNQYIIYNQDFEILIYQIYKIIIIEIYKHFARIYQEISLENQ